MKVINAFNIDFKTLNSEIKEAAKVDSNIKVINVNGQRYIGDGISGNSTITIDGVPGNDMAAFMNGTKMIVSTNGQDAIANTMNNGEVIVHGNAGDTLGYAMRGGTVYIKGNAGYRAGINMKEYKSHFPAMIIGGKAGDFLGEYMAGGLIIVLGLNTHDTPVGKYCGTGMFGGEMYIRGDYKETNISRDVEVSEVNNDNIEKILSYLKEYCSNFSTDLKDILSKPFYKVSPSTARPYKKLYVC